MKRNFKLILFIVSLVYIYSICLPVIAKSAQPEYSDKDYKEVRACLDSYLSSVLSLNLETALSCKLPGYEHRCKLVVLENTESDSNKAQLKGSYYIHPIQPDLYEKYGEIHYQYGGPPVKYEIVAAQPYKTTDLTRSNGYIDGIRVKVVINDILNVSYHARDEKGNWKIYTLGPRPNFKGSNIYYYSNNTRQLNTQKPVSRTGNTHTNYPLPFDPVTTSVTAALFGFILSNIRRNRKYVTSAELTKVTYDILIPDLKKSKVIWPRVGRTLTAASGVINFVDAYDYCQENPYSNNTSRYGWAVFETIAPVGASFLVGKLLPVAVVTTTAIISFEIAVPVIIGLATPYLLDMVESKFFRSKPPADIPFD